MLNKRKIKTAINIWRERGFRFLMSRVLERTIIALARFRANLYMRMHQSIAIGELKEFTSDDPASAFNFAEKKFLGGIAPGQAREEFLPLLSIFQNLKPQTVVEIGTEKGGTFFCFCKLAPSQATLISIDLPDGPFGGGYAKWRIPFYRAFAKAGQTLHFLRENSHAPQALEKLKLILGERPIDFLFIDADHTYTGVKMDFEMYGSLVRRGGVIAFHDITPYPKELGNEVHIFWNEIKNKHDHEEFVSDWNQNWGGIGVLYIKK